MSSTKNKGKFPVVIWITGLPGSGKTTIGKGVYEELKSRGIEAEFLDGDAIRKIFPNTGFTKEERDKHIRRVGHLASMLERHGITVVASSASLPRRYHRLIRFFVP